MLAAMDRECNICTEIIGEARADGTVELGVTLPCNHSFGLHW
jgi:hypothetical protein